MRHSDEESLSFCAVLTCYVLTMCCVIAASVATLQLLGSCVHMAVSGPTVAAILYVEASDWSK